MATTALPCRGCSANRESNLVQLGVRADKWDHIVALAGNPNTGKSTVFNALTGLRQHTGNWPGKTVSRAEGVFEHDGERIKLIDLPGTYSLQAGSADEEVARDFVLFGEPDVTVVVVDATRLERNLNLVLQVLEITDRAVVCLNLMDEARRRGIGVDPARLADELGVPVVPTAARTHEGIPKLVEVIHQVAHGQVQPKPFRIASHPEEVEASVRGLVGPIQNAFPDLPNARWVALRLLNGDERVTSAGVRRVGQDFLVAGHGGVETHFTGGVTACADANPLDERAIGQHQDRGPAHARPGPVPTCFLHR